MSLLTAELRKVWGNRVFPMLLAVLVTANLLLLWMGTRPTSNQPPAAAYRAVGADLAALGSDMAAKGDLLHSKLDETASGIQRMATASFNKITGRKMPPCSTSTNRCTATRATRSTPIA